MTEEEGTDLVRGVLSEDTEADVKYKEARHEISNLIHDRVEDKIDAIDLLARVDYSLRMVAECNQVDGHAVLNAFGVGLKAFMEEPGTRHGSRRTRPR